MQHERLHLQFYFVYLFIFMCLLFVFRLCSYFLFFPLLLALATCMSELVWFLTHFHFYFTLLFPLCENCYRYRWRNIMYIISVALNFQRYVYVSVSVCVCAYHWNASSWKCFTKADTLHFQLHLHVVFPFLFFSSFQSSRNFSQSYRDIHLRTYMCMLTRWCAHINLSDCTVKHRLYTTDNILDSIKFCNTNDDWLERPRNEHMKNEHLNWISKVQFFFCNIFSFQWEIILIIQSEIIIWN